MIKYKKAFQSFEGEGPKIGLKTLFLTYDKNKGEQFDWNAFYRQTNRPQAVYVNFEEGDYDFFSELEEFQSRFECYTFETAFSSYLSMKDHNLPMFGSWFIRIEEEDVADIDCNEIIELSRSPLNVTFKIEASPLDFVAKINIANFLVSLRKNIKVDIMPLFKECVGGVMMNNFDAIHPDVRVMPPTQFLIDMK